MKLLQTIATCCSSMTTVPLGREDAEQIAAAFKALADPIRVQIVSRVAASDEAELCACDLPAALGISQPTVSHHLRILTEAGILDREARGKWAFFRLRPEALSTMRQLLADTP